MWGPCTIAQQSTSSRYPPMTIHFQSGSRDAAHFSELVHQIYEAAIYPERWSELMATIAASFGTEKGLLFTPYVAPQNGGFIFPAGISEDTLQLWATSYIDLDIWAKGGMERDLWRTGNVLI